jgi:RNA polymerase sigma factor (TIGR02999 family)
MSPARPRAADITGLLHAWRAGDDAAFQQLTSALYSELRRIAHGVMSGEAPGRTIQATALANEAYLKLIDVRRVQWKDRTHFLALSARIMRRILVDFARERGYQKRGGDAQRVGLGEVAEFGSAPEPLHIALHDALRELEKRDERKSRVVELRYFGGLSVPETAEVLNVSGDTVLRDWRLAKAWLLREIQR